MNPVLVVIVSYNNPHLTLAAVDSAANQTIPTEVIVWDNNSPDAEVAHILSNHWFPANVTVEYCSSNLMWSPAVNAAVHLYRRADHEFLCFSNNDLTFNPDTMERMVAVLNHKGAGLAGPMGSGVGGPQDYATHKEAFLAAGHGADEAFRAQPPHRVSFLMGVCMFTSFVAWDEVGPLDAAMPLGADDHDYSLRMKEAGYGLWVDPGAMVKHKCHATESASQWTEFGAASWKRFNEKWAGYFFDEQEAKRCHWDGKYEPGWESGTGWLSPEKRKIIYAQRR